jgi:hypothetical protein
MVNRGLQTLEEKRLSQDSTSTATSYSRNFCEWMLGGMLVQKKLSNTEYDDQQQESGPPTNVHAEKTEQYPLISGALISQFASSISSARDFWPRECAGVDAEFFRLRPRRPAAAASFSSRFLRASIMPSKLMTLAFLTTVDLVDARMLLSLFCLNRSEFSWNRRSRADIVLSAALANF